MFFKKKSEPKPVHKHDYNIFIASQNETIKKRKWTHIIWRCECGLFHLDTIPGKWNAELFK
uniref:Uncharacterized protein n=1 Tax=viral metagenome TaxID=1070528 RepID=A0A6M3LNF7_9ZZZZ